jgi:hypothetical protein
MHPLSELAMAPVAYPAPPPVAPPASLASKVTLSEIAAYMQVSEAKADLREERRLFWQCMNLAGWRFLIAMALSYWKHIAPTSMFYISRVDTYFPESYTESYATRLAACFAIASLVAIGFAVYQLDRWTKAKSALAQARENFANQTN